MGTGRRADIVAGQLSRILHGLRGPRTNTVRDLHHYFGLAPEAFFPKPPPLEDVRIQRTLMDRLIGASSLSWQSTHEVLCPRYRRRHRGEYSTNLTAHARWLRPERGRLRRTCLIYVHGWLEPGSWVEEAFMFPRWVRELGVDILHVSLPFHGARNPRSALFPGEYFWTADLVRSFEAVRQAVHDTRSIMGWLRHQGYARVGVAGVSFGGSCAMMMACVEPLPDFVIPIVCHTQLGLAVEHAAILWRIKRDLQRWGIDAGRRLELFSKLAIEDYVCRLEPDRQLWIDARHDEHIDPKLVTQQWERWGRPNLHWIPGGHMTFPLQLKEITAAMKNFLDGLPAGSDSAA